MKLFSLNLLRFAALVLAGSWLNFAQAIEIQSWQTANQVKVLLIEAPEIPMLDLELTFDAGSARDGAQPGLANLTASLLDSGSKTKTEQQISSAFNNLGAEFSTSVNRDFASFGLRSLSRESLLNPALDLFAELLSQPKFPAKVFKREQARILQALAQQHEQPGYLANLEFWQTLYPNHPYGKPTDGTIESISRLKPKDLHRFYQEFYIAENAQIAMVGAINRQQAEQIAEQIAQALPSGKPAQPLPAPGLVTQAQTKQIEFKSAQTHYLLGQLGIERGHPDYHALFLANHLLGGSGFGSILMEEVREKRGLVYGVSSFFAPLKVAGPWLVNLTVENAQASTADQVVRAELTKFLQDFPADNFAAIKNNIISGWPLRVASNSKMLGYLTMLGFYDLPLSYIDDFPVIISSLSKQDVLAAWQRFSQPENLINIQVGQFEQKAKN